MAKDGIIKFSQTCAYKIRRGIQRDMNIAERIRHIRKDIRLVRIPLKQAAEVIENYFKHLGWPIQKENRAENNFSITGHSPEFTHSRFFLTRKPVE